LFAISICLQVGTGSIPLGLEFYSLTFHTMKKLLAMFGVLALAFAGCVTTDVDEDVVDDVVADDVVDVVVDDEEATE
jgi:hypothetical protein